MRVALCGGSLCVFKELSGSELVGGLQSALYYKIIDP